MTKAPIAGNYWLFYLAGSAAIVEDVEDDIADDVDFTALVKVLLAGADLRETVSAACEAFVAAFVKDARACWDRFLAGRTKDRAVMDMFRVTDTPSLHERIKEAGGSQSVAWEAWVQGVTDSVVSIATAHAIADLEERFDEEDEEDDGEEEDDDEEEEDDDEEDDEDDDKGH